jgi:hypothetical protein
MTEATEKTEGGEIDARANEETVQVHSGSLKFENKNNTNVSVISDGPEEVRAPPPPMISKVGFSFAKVRQFSIFRHSQITQLNNI